MFATLLASWDEVPLQRRPARKAVVRPNDSVPKILKKVDRLLGLHRVRLGTSPKHKQKEQALRDSLRPFPSPVQEEDKANDP